jgi:nitrite reductase/ring-hydroxylating ferredoxin subunit
MPTLIACRFDELTDGAVRRVTIERRTIAVVRNADRVYAFIDSCPHKGGSLADGQVSASRCEIICPWHRFRFHLDSGVSVTNPEMSVRSFPAHVDDGQVLVSFP